MRRILVVHDADSFPQDLIDELQPLGAEVVSAAGATAGLSATRLAEPDLLILALSAADPWDLPLTLREDSETGQIPILAYRPSPSNRDKESAREAGCSSYDGPPLNGERLRSKAMALMRSNPLRQLRPVPRVEDVPTPAPVQPEAHILVVEDEPIVREMLRRRLEGANFRVSTAATGAEGLLAIGGAEPDLVLLDLGLPDINGLEVLWQIRERASTDELPVIVVTGRASSLDMSAAIDVGANDYLVKPVEGPVLLGRIRLNLRLLAKSRELRESEERYRLLAEHATDMVTRSSPDGIWRYVSPSSRKLLGYRPEELIGRSAYDLIHPDDFDALAENHDAVGGADDMFALRYRMRRADGTWAWVETTMNALRDPETGGVREVLGATRDISVQVERQSAATEEMMVRFARIAEFRSGETSGHIQRMSRSCGILAGRAGQNSLRCEQIRLAATLHDFGNILIPMGILHKEGQLTREEFEVVKRGPELGYELLRGSGNEVLELAATISWYHHEHWDGSGYPRGKRGRGIPLEGRIALICDVFDMMTSRRPYRDALPVGVAIEHLSNARGSLYDPSLLDAFLSDLDEIIALRRAFPDPA